MNDVLLLEAHEDFHLMWRKLIKCLITQSRHGTFNLNSSRGSQVSYRPTTPDWKIHPSPVGLHDIWQMNINKLPHPVSREQMDISYADLTDRDLKKKKWLHSQSSKCGVRRLQFSAQQVTSDRMWETRLLLISRPMILIHSFRAGSEMHVVLRCLLYTLNN